MNRGKDGVITKGCLLTKPSRRRSGVCLPDGLAELSIEGIMIDDPYKAY